MSRLLTAAAALIGYAILAVALTWPLAIHMRSTLPGDPGGDTGVYVWNVWHVHREIDRGRSPFHSERIFADTWPADLSQHNTTLAPALAVSAVVPRAGSVTAFNVAFIGLLAAAGFAVFLLAWDVTRDPVASWVAGALATASPCLLARSTEHLSLMAIGVVPVFMLGWTRMLRDRSFAWAAVAGVAMAVAAYSDPYLAIYCTLLAAWFGAGALLRLETRRAPVRPARWPRVVDGILVLLAVVVVSILITGGWEGSIGGVRVAARTLYTPVLILSVLGVARAIHAARPRVSWSPTLPLTRLLALGATSVVTASTLLAPWLMALYARQASSQIERPDVLWRSSPPGVDLAAFVAPSPWHPWWGRAVMQWLESMHPGGFAEFTPAVSLTAVAILLVGVLRRCEFPRRWVAVTLACVACALGPFVHIAGVNTAVPGPWAFLRYVPAIEWARSPSRFALVALVCISVLVAISLARLRRDLPTPRQWLWLVVIALVGAFEVLPGRMPLFPVSVPTVFATLAADEDRRATVLELPVGLRDGASSIGNFSARTQFFQTFHGKRLIGGYLSRVSARRKDAARSMPVFSALLTLSGGGAITDAERLYAASRRDGFVARTGLRYVVIDERRCSAALDTFARDVLDLEWLGTDGGYTLYRVRPGTAQPAAVADASATTTPLPR